MKIQRTLHEEMWGGFDTSKKQIGLMIRKPGKGIFESVGVGCAALRRYNETGRVGVDIQLNSSWSYRILTTDVQELVEAINDMDNMDSPPPEPIDIWVTDFKARTLNIYNKNGQVVARSVCCRVRKEKYTACVVGIPTPMRNMVYEFDMEVL